MTEDEIVAAVVAAPSINIGQLSVRVLELKEYLRSLPPVIKVVAYNEGAVLLRTSDLADYASERDLFDVITQEEVRDIAEQSSPPPLNVENEPEPETIRALADWFRGINGADIPGIDS